MILQIFMDKIQKICNVLQPYVKDIPSRNTNVNILSCFREMTEDEAIKIIGKCHQNLVN